MNRSRAAAGEERGGGNVRRIAITTAVVLAAATGLALAGPGHAHAATLAVTACSGSGPGSLPAAVAGAAPGDAITIDPAVCGTITLPGILGIAQNLTIDGPGVAVSDGGSGPDFDINSGTTVGISGLTIEGGGGFAGAGGGVYTLGTVNLTDVTIAGNSISGSNGDGGGIYNNDGTVTLIDSTVSGNAASGQAGSPPLPGLGGGIYSLGGTVTVTDSTVSGNAAGQGGGIAATNGAIVTLTDSTVSGNTAAGNGGGIAATNGAIVTLTGSTVSGNTAAGNGGGIYTDGTGNFGDTTVIAGATIVAGNTSGIGPNCSGLVTSAGYNLTDDASCGFTPPADVVAANPLVGQLANNGGPTQTVLPLAGSPAVGVIPPNTTLNGAQACPRADQRGVESAPGADCTIGAVEVVAAAPVVTAPTVTGVSPSSGPVAGGTSVSVTGSGFTGATAVDFGAVPAVSFAVTSDGQLTAVAPADSAGPVDVTVTGPGGTSATGPADQFSYVEPPAITSGSSVTFVAGASGSFTVQAAGYPGGAAISITESGALPAGVTFTGNGDGTATLAGTPAKGAKAGDYPLVITAANGVAPPAVQDFTLVVKDPATIKVLLIPGTAVTGVPVLATAVLTAGDSGGTVSFAASFDGGPAVPVPGCQKRSLFLNAAACLFTPGTAAGPGTYTVTASYSGDATYASATGSASLPALARTSLALASSSSPGAGSPVTVTAQVSPVPGGGSVSFLVTGPGGRNVPLPASCTAAPAGPGTVSCTFTPAAKGGYDVTAVYSGDALYLQSARSLEVQVS
jgi:IPT/TIG domain/Bacterial Ig-like domain (group 3)